MSRIRGLELLHNLVRNQLKSKEDCLVAALHCLLVNEALQCVGIGSEFSEADVRSTTELLPGGWNENQEVYTLRYTSRDHQSRYLVKIVKAGHMLLFNVILDENTTASMSIDVVKHIGETYNDFPATYSELDTLSQSFNTEIWQKLHACTKKPSTSSPSQSRRSQSEPIPNPLLVRPSRDIGIDRGFPPSIPLVGRSDLDPFGRGFESGGGMLMDPSDFGFPSRPHQPPYGPHGIPRGSIPPGARFDPFGPPVRGPNRGDPDPDHEHRYDFI